MFITLATLGILPEELMLAYTEDNIIAIENDEDRNKKVIEYISKQVNDMGYEKADLFENNFMVYLSLAFLIIIAVCLLLLGLCSCMCQWFNSYVSKLKKDLFWNSFIRFGLEVALESSISCMIQVRFVSADDSQVASYTSIAVASLAGLVCFAVAIPIFLDRNQSRLTDEDFKSKYGSLVLFLKTK